MSPLSLSDFHRVEVLTCLNNGLIGYPSEACPIEVDSVV